MSDYSLSLDLRYSDSRVDDFGPDRRDVGRVPYAIQWSTQDPGGFGSGSFVVSRPPNLRAEDASLFAEVFVYGPGVRGVYEGRVTGIPQVGVNEVRFETEGWSAALEDNEAFYLGPVIDRDLSHWKETSGPRQAAMIGVGNNPKSVSTSVDTNQAGDAGFSSTTQGQFYKPLGEWVYDAGAGAKVGRVYVTAFGLYNFVADASGSATAFAWASDNPGSEQNAGELLATSPWNYAPATPTRFIGLRWQRLDGPPVGGGSAGLDYGVFWTGPVVYGNTALTLVGSLPGGFYASDILGYVLDRAAPMLNYTIGDSIEPSGFAMPHYVKNERSTARGIVEELTAFGGAALVPNSWGVYDNRTFFHKTPGFGRTWRVRKDEVATPTSDGPQSKERTVGMAITYTDGAGQEFSVGPPGSGCDFETADLLDTDPQNPASRLQGRIKHRQVGITNQQGALNIGRMLLAEANRVDWQGTVEIQAEARDSAGNLYPACHVRACDNLEIEDDDGVTGQIINSTDYDEDSDKVTVHIGAPPDRGEVLLAQLAAATDLVT